MKLLEKYPDNAGQKFMERIVRSERKRDLTELRNLCLSYYDEIINCAENLCGSSKNLYPFQRAFDAMMRVEKYLMPSKADNYREPGNCRRSRTSIINKGISEGWFDAHPRKTRMEDRKDVLKWLKLQSGENGLKEYAHENYLCAKGNVLYKNDKQRFFGDNLKAIAKGLGLNYIKVVTLQKDTQEGLQVNGNEFTLYIHWGILHGEYAEYSENGNKVCRSACFERYGFDLKVYDISQALQGNETQLLRLNTMYEYNKEEFKNALLQLLAGIPDQIVDN